MSPEQSRGAIVLDRAYAGESGTLRDVRHDVVACLRASIVDQELEERAQLVVSELATNAIQASPGTMYDIRVSLGSDHSVVVRVSSWRGRGVPPAREAWGPATDVAVRGRGLLIVAKLSDEVEVEQPTAGTVVVTVTLRPASSDRGD